MFYRPGDKAPARWPGAIASRRTPRTAVPEARPGFEDRRTAASGQDWVAVCAVCAVGSAVLRTTYIRSGQPSGLWLTASTARRRVRSWPLPPARALVFKMFRHLVFHATTRRAPGLRADAFRERGMHGADAAQGRLVASLRFAFGFK